MIRAFSGLIYVALLLLAIFSLENAYLILILAFGSFCLYEFLRLVQIKSKLWYLVLIAVVLFFCYFRITPKGTLLFLVFTIAVNLYLIKNLIRPSNEAITSVQKFSYALFYLIGGITFMILLPSYQGGYVSYLVASIFGIIWINDTFAFIVGKSMGKRKLYERISPNKTVEGFIGGLVFSCLAGVLIYKYFYPKEAGLTLQLWVFIALLTSVFGTLGDLIQSQLKRQVGVKDSGQLMPGHGGLYDRLDSILFASPFIYLFLIVLDYVS